jgi:predicted DNA-binding protein
MSVVQMDQAVAKKASTTTVRLPSDIVDKARIVAAHTGRDMSEVLAEVLAPAMDKAYKQVIAKAARETLKGESDK